MKKLFFLLSLFLLASCSYSDGCLFLPQSVHCVDKGEHWPAIAAYQKPNTIGHTDSEQRLKDALACGAKDSTLVDTPNNYTINGKFYKMFRNCMADRGYIRFTSAECGYMNPKWDEGKCNL